MRRFFKIVGLGMLCIVGCLVLVVALAYSMGTVTVSVNEKAADGHHLYVPVPAVVIPLGMRLVPPEDMADAAGAVRPWLPAIKAASEELGRCPDTTLVEVTSSEEKVRIAKRGGSLLIDVDSPDEDVHLSVPLETAYRVASQFEDLEDRVRRSAKRGARVTAAADFETSN